MLFVYPVGKTDLAWGRNIYEAGDFYDVVISPTGDSRFGKGRYLAGGESIAWHCPRNKIAPVS